jgi:hypothetical protein
MSTTEDPKKRSDSTLAYTRAFVTVGALVIAVVHAIWPSLTIDTVTIALVVIAILPWLAPMLKSVEIAGNKFEFREELDKVTSQMQDANLLPQNSSTPPPSSTTASIMAPYDPILELSNLRREIETRLVKIAESRGMETYRYGPNQLTRNLTEKGVFTPKESFALQDFITVINRVIRNKLEIDPADAKYAVDAGAKFLPWLDGIIGKQKTEVDPVK